MNTKHQVFFSPAQDMSSLKDGSVDLIVTSPPYPMIEMWDDIMAKQNVAIAKAQLADEPNKVFELMNQELDKVWRECYRVLADGGFLCINIGDATRTINGDFKLYNNHSRIAQYCNSIGFNEMPCILWRKPTNAPNKFMGSGMLPNGAYVTLEHEYILIFRKGSKRQYKKEQEKNIRNDSAFFWEERNVWFSDVWTFKGTKQIMKNKESRERSASFPLELPYRLINMYSQKGDIVLDPFMGLGTTIIASIISGRNSIGFEIDNSLKKSIIDRILAIDIDNANSLIKQRFDNHIQFVADRESVQKKEVKHYNSKLDCKVMTKQEENLTLNYVQSIYITNNESVLFGVDYMEETNLRELPFITKKSLF